MRLSTSFRVLTFLLLGAALVVAAPPVRAQGDLVVKKPIDRRFPEGQFCALPVDIEFTSPGSSVRVVFEARVFILDPNDNQLHWTQQSIDNVMLTDAAAYDAHTFAPPSGSASENCYNPEPAKIPYLYFNDAGLTFQLSELFDTDPTARGWDMTHGAYFHAGSAPRNPEVAFPVDDDGGSLGLGLDSASPSADEVASTEIVINGLTQGENFNLSAWWDAHHVIFGSTETFLTVSVFGSGPTPVARKSWGVVKRAYR